MSEEIDQAKEVAWQKASKYVAGLLITPDQLDKVEQIRRKVLRNKASVDSRLRTAVQSQIDGIRSGLQELKTTQDEISHVKKLLGEVSGIFEECEPLSDKLLKVKVTHEKHAKLAKTNSHLQLIFNVPETIKKTQELIEKSQLLQAHKNIMELEATRDDLLLEVYKIYKDDNEEDRYTESPLFTYFSQVENLSVQLNKQISWVVERTLATARQKPTQLVTALRIVEREERADDRCLAQQKETGFIPPGRPKCWRKHCHASIKKSIDNRFDSNQLELSDKSDKMWLVRHLERMRVLMLEDLIAVKYHARQCFPPSHQIFKMYIYNYHEAMSRMLEGFALNQNPSRPNECVTLLQWVAEYYGAELLGHPELKAYVEVLREPQNSPGEYVLEDLLSKGVIDSLKETYISTTQSNIRGCLEKMALSESQDWSQEAIPECDSQDYFQSSLPIILFQLLDQNIQVGAFIDKEIKLRILDVCAASLMEFIDTYKEAVERFKIKYYEDRTAFKYFEPFMASICNNILIVAEFTQQMKNEQQSQLGIETFTEKRGETFTQTVHAYKQFSQHVCEILLNSVFLDLEQFFQDLLTRKWLTSPVIIDTVIATLEDYSNDYTHLKPEAFEYIMKAAEDRVILEYVRAVLSRRITCRNYDERKECKEQMCGEAKKISAAIQRISKLEGENSSSVCSILPKMAEVIGTREKTDLELDIASLVQEFSDFRADHALALLAIRGDIGRTECLQLISDHKIRETSDESTAAENSIFARVTPAGSVLESLESRFKK